MDGVALRVDGMRIRAPKGSSILDVALANDIYIPHLCHHPDLAPVGVCRLCLVEAEGRGVVLACKTPADEGMVVKTDTAAIQAMRRVTVELLLVNHIGTCVSCAKNGDCELQTVARFVGIDDARLARLRRTDRVLPVDASNPFFVFDPNKCVLCGICVRTCEQLQGVSAIDFANRGYASTVATFAGRPLVASRCESCGECVVRCPVGALAPKEALPPAREVETVCPYCGCGCGLCLGVRGGTITGARGNRASPVNHGSLCVKGRFGHTFVNHPDRLTTPLVKRDGEFVPVQWEEALAYVAKRFREYKGDQFALVASAKCTNEDNYVLQKFARVVMQTNTVDHCARLCHSPSMAGLSRCFGSGAMTNSIGDIADAACILAVGTNTTEAHPIIGLQVRRAAQKGAKLIVANPRTIDLCRHASVLLQQRPGTDVALLMGMARVIVEESLYDRSFVAERTRDFEAFRASLADFDLESVAQTTGVPSETIAEAARMYATNRPACILYAMGITQHSHGTDNVLALGNLALLTGNVGKPGSGINALRGQNNVQGACDMGALPAFYPGYQQVGDPTARTKFEAAWNRRLDDKPGLTLTEMSPAARAGKIRAIYLVGENPLLSEADSGEVEEAMRGLEFLVVQDIFLSETAALADVVLPAATFAEKDGTFTNTERRVQLIRRAIDPVGESRPDWAIARDLARTMGVEGFDWQSTAEVMGEIAALTPIYGGISHARLASTGGLQWPCRDIEHPGTGILHVDRFATADGKGVFVPLTYRPPAEMPDDDYPFLLTTGRSLFHYHTGTMTRRVEGLDFLNNREWLEVNPVDASALGIVHGEIVRITSRRGQVEARAKVTHACPERVVYLSFHFHECPTNRLTSPALDPVAKIPETKVCAVRLEKARAGKFRSTSAAQREERAVEALVVAHPT